jgi:hypothetical protein
MDFRNPVGAGLIPERIAKCDMDAGNFLFLE